MSLWPRAPALRAVFTVTVRAAGMAGAASALAHALMAARRRVWFFALVVFVVFICFAFRFWEAPPEADGPSALFFAGADRQAGGFTATNSCCLLRRSQTG